MLLEVEQVGTDTTMKLSSSRAIACLLRSLRYTLLPHALCRERDGLVKTPEKY